MKPSARLNGAGLGLKRELIPQIQAEYGSTELANLGLLEIAPENWMGAGGRHAYQLAWFAERYPLVCHGLSLSLGGPDPLNEDLLNGIKLFLDAYRVPLYTEHLSYCSDFVEGHRGYLYDLLPIPFTDEAVDYVARRIRRAQEILERRIAVENVSYYVSAPISEMDEVSFIKAVLLEADCDLHLDVNNIYVNSLNFGFDPVAYLQAIHDAGLGHRVVYAHVAGHYQESPQLIIDSHGESVVDPVWSLLQRAYALFGAVPTILERDNNIPPLSDLLIEVDRIAKLQTLQVAREQPVIV